MCRERMEGKASSRGDSMVIFRFVGRNLDEKIDLSYFYLLTALSLLFILLAVNPHWMGNSELYPMLVTILALLFLIVSSLAFVNVVETTKEVGKNESKA